MNPDLDHTDILIVSAYLPELAGLRDMLGDAFAASVGGLEVVARAVGIGVPDAAAGMAFELCRRAPRAVVFVGTAGAYHGRGLAIGQVVVGRRLNLVSMAAATGGGAFPAPMPVVVQTDAELSMALMGGSLPEVRVATTLAITTDDALASMLSASVDADVEHLEAFAVVAACARRRIACGVVLGIANIVGSTAREEWRIHNAAAGRAAASVVTQWIASGAPAVRR